MHESRMIAVVVPPGLCAIEKVSGSRIATPLAPPSPGSTPMITPRMMPTNMNATFFRLSATAKPCMSASISAIGRALTEAEDLFERSLGQRHEEPDLEDEIEHGRRADAHHRHLPPRILAEPAHEEGDEHGRCDVDAEPADQRDIDRRGHQHREHQCELSGFDERAIGLAFQPQAAGEIDGRRDAYEKDDVERKVARLRPVLGPARAQARAVPHDQHAEKKKERRDGRLGALVTESRASPFLCRKPAAFMSSTFRCSSLATQSAYSLPSSEVVL